MHQEDEIIDVGVSFDDVEEGTDFHPLPNGTFMFETSGLKTARASKTNNLLLRPVMKVLNPPKDGLPAGKQWGAYHQITVSPESMFRVKQLYKALGLKWQGSKLNIAELRRTLETKKRILADVEQENYQGKLRAKSTKLTAAPR